MPDFRVADLILLEAYTAGIFDGEGSIHIKEHRTKWNSDTISYSVKIEIINTEIDWLYDLRAQWGNIGYIHHRSELGNRRATADWQMSSSDAIKFLKTVRPYLRIKAERADLVLSLCLPGIGTHLTAEQRQAWAQARNTLSVLNQRGVNPTSLKVDEITTRSDNRKVA